jgi:prepilin-type N-terminal cleavage/methylation domain-containing protein
MKQTKKAFTLVELIIVITILAILATIGFMSYQSYTSDARNSKRTNDLASIESKFVVVVAKDPTKMLTSVDTTWT